MPTKELSSAELHLWNIVENNPDKIAKMSIVKLSQFANVSTATIVRMPQLFAPCKRWVTVAILLIAKH